MYDMTILPSAIKGLVLGVGRSPAWARWPPAGCCPAVALPGRWLSVSLAGRWLAPAWSPAAQAPAAAYPAPAIPVGAELHGGTGVVGPRRISSKSRGNHYLVLFICVVDPGVECIGPRCQKFLASPLVASKLKAQNEMSGTQL